MSRLEIYSPRLVAGRHSVLHDSGLCVALSLCCCRTIALSFCYFVALVALLPDRSVPALSYMPNTYLLVRYVDKFSPPVPKEVGMSLGRQVVPVRT